MGDSGMESAAEGLLGIGEMRAQFDVTARTLRFYEAKELLFPIREGQKRLYTRRCRARLELILQGKRFGFSLEEIRQLLGLYDLDDGQTTQLARTVAIARERLRAMIARRDEMTLAIDDLERQIAWGVRTLSGRGVALAAE